MRGFQIRLCCHLADISEAPGKHPLARKNTELQNSVLVEIGKRET